MSRRPISRRSTSALSVGRRGLPESKFCYLALGATLVYYTLYDTYLLALIPSALLLTYLALPRFRWSQTAAFAGVPLLVPLYCGVLP